MRIFICTMEEPVYTLQFIKDIITARRNDVIGLAVSKGDRLTIGKKRSKVVYLFSLLLIMGPIHFFKYSVLTLNFKFKKFLAEKIQIIQSPSILHYAERVGIKTFNIKTMKGKKQIKERILKWEQERKLIRVYLEDYKLMSDEDKAKNSGLREMKWNLEKRLSYAITELEWVLS